jgi:hypothetical protein
LRYGIGVEAERHVVDEHAAVDLGEVDATLATFDERIEGADNIVAVDAEIEREMVARPRRDAGVRNPGACGGGRHQRLRTVAAGHRERVGAARERRLDQLGEVLSG